MITKEQLDELNKIICEEHNQSPKAKFKGDDLKFEYCCEDFKQKINDFVHDQTLKNVQDITRQAFGLE